MWWRYNLGEDTRVTTGEERNEALRRLREALGARREVPLDEARPLPIRRLDTPAARDPSYVAQPFFAGPVRAERPWIQPLVAAGLSLTLAGSLLALPLIGGGLSRTSGPGLALPADVPGDMVEVDVPLQPTDEGTVSEPPTPPGAGTTAPEGEPAAPTSAPPSDTDGAPGDDIVPPTIPPFPPVPEVPPGDRASAPPPPQQQPPTGPPGPPIAGPIPDTPGDDAADEETPDEEAPHEGEQPPADGDEGEQPTDGGDEDEDGDQGEQPPGLDEGEGEDGDEGDGEEGDEGLPPCKEEDEDEDEDTGGPEAA
jgi:hypothetical protein